MRGTEIGGENYARGRIESEKGRSATAGRRAITCFDKHAEPQQLVDPLRDRRAGEPGCAGELGTRGGLLPHNEGHQLAKLKPRTVLIAH